MRLRNIKGSKEEVEKDEQVIQSPKEYKGKWNALFGNNNPIHIEIGMGKGKFILELASNNPDINYIGIEKYSSVLFRAVEKLRETDNKYKNLYFIRFDAEYILDIFGVDEISRIYLNFSDPWPKDRHAKRRLTSKEFLGKYEHCLNESGEVEFKTDNAVLFDFSVEQVKHSDWILSVLTYDLHNSEYIDGNIMTEYEEKFVSEGKPIHKIIANKRNE